MSTLHFTNAEYEKNAKYDLASHRSRMWCAIAQHERGKQKKFEAGASWAARHRRWPQRQASLLYQQSLSSPRVLRSATADTTGQAVAPTSTTDSRNKV